MANEDLLKSVTFQASRLDATVLPPGLTQAFSLYLLQQSQGNDSVANKANQAAEGAYQAQLRNDEQDQEIDDLDDRVSASEQSIQSLSGRVDSAESAIGTIQNDYVSKSAIPSQTILSPLNVTTSLSVGGTKVVGARVTGFPDLTGTGYFGTFNADLTQSISATYVQAESQALATQIQTARRRIKALEDALKAHGLISI
ncbi:phage tail protein [Pantoea agglomerans]|uniref:phage tail protein n=1 Tax=Enterobacter agglomerans TaxID=549 RepID=UPI003DA12FEE